VTLAPGDHLWAVAERTLAAAQDRRPPEREVVRYWRSLVELNRSDLPDPADPDLVFPGDVIRLPPV
jgi:nucleoid-associated protein YgaU